MLIFRNYKILATLVVAGLFSFSSIYADDCHPQVDANTPQYIVGYGSLMDASSKRLSEPDAGVNLPVLVWASCARGTPTATFDRELHL